jgi:hypothetical protein
MKRVSIAMLVAITCWPSVPTTASSQQAAGLDDVMALAAVEAAGRFVSRR